MPLSDVMRLLGQYGLQVTEPQVRWAIKTNRVARPAMDGSHRFDFTEENVAELVTYFRSRGRREVASA